MVFYLLTKLIQSQQQERHLNFCVTYKETISRRCSYYNHCFALIRVHDIKYVYLLFFRLTERERKQRKSKKELLKLAQEHEKARELEKVQRYHMPRDLGKGETADYVEVDELEKLPQSEQKKWEKEQMTSAVFSFGAKNKLSTSENQYDLLIEDQIEFIQALQIPG